VPKLHLNPAKKLNLNDEYSTPPPSPGIIGLDKDSIATPPVPPPRQKREKKTASNIKSLQISPDPSEVGSYLIFL